MRTSLDSCLRKAFNIIIPEIIIINTFSRGGKILFKVNQEIEWVNIEGKQENAFNFRRGLGRNLSDYRRVEGKGCNWFECQCLIKL